MGEGPPGRRTRGRAIALSGARTRDQASRGLAQAAFGWLSARLAAEADAGRFALWLPVAFGTGAAIYFSAAREPALWAALTAAALALGAVIAARKTFGALWLALLAAFLAAGFLAGKIATLRAEAPVLARATTAEIAGRIVLVEPRKAGMRRVTIALERFGRLADDDKPARVRVVVGKNPPLSAGERVSLTAFWRPPEGPARPGGYDFARVAYFQEIGATGFGARDIRALPAVGEGFFTRTSAALERLRAELTQRISSTVGGPEGAVAAALVTGVQGPIPRETEDELRAAGLSHILSISGLHMALVAGTMFIMVRALLALIPSVALRWPVKQIAAAFALAGATFYLALSGAEVATQRSYVMIAIAFVAILVGRPALAPRNFALAALVCIAWTPEALLGPSFQMSFAAVAGLVAWFEARRDREPEPPSPTQAARIRRKVATWAALAVMTTVVAGLATAPFAAYHFHRVTPYAIAGNALAEPIIGLVVMPSVVGGLFFAPLGLDAWWWRLMGLGLEGVLWIAKAVASWPGAERALPAFGPAALLLFSGGLAWLCLWRTALRWAAVPALGIALLLAAFPGRPDVVVDPLGRALAARGPDGKLAIVGDKPSAFAAKVWLAADGVEPGEAGGAGASRCDALACVAPLNGGGLVSLVRDARAFDEDCRRAALVVTRLDAPAACAETAAVIDRRTLAATGAMTLTRDGTRFVATAARDPVGSRPWTAQADGAPPDQAVRLTFSAHGSTAREHARPQPVDPTEGDDGAAEAPPDDQ